MSTVLSLSSTKGSLKALRIERHYADCDIFSVILRADTPNASIPTAICAFNDFSPHPPCQRRQSLELGIMVESSIGLAITVF
jgi:hypothetical protein